jgi:hypothetical protein
MAASSIVPARRRPAGRALVAHAAARSAPRGAGLATVVALPVRHVGARASSAELDLAPAPVRPALRVVEAPVRRRAGTPRILAVAVALLMGVAVLLGSGMLAAPADPVATGHVVLQPGETLWDIAVRSAPAGVDPRRQLETLRRLNGFGPGALDAWTVVLIPAHAPAG